MKHNVANDWICQISHIGLAFEHYQLFELCQETYNKDLYDWLWWHTLINSALGMLGRED
jgi:hypothetical protein